MSTGPSIKGREAFAAAAGTLVPATSIDGVWNESASQLGVPDRLGEFYALLPDDKARKDLSQLLMLMSNPVGGLLLYGRPKKFASLSEEQHGAALRRMMKSRLVMVRQGAKVLKLIVGFLLANPPTGERSWPVWEAMGYPGPQGPPPTEPKRLQPVKITTPTEWTVDVVVVGSGAGGGVAAAVLAASGLDVVVLEKGGYRNEADFTHLEIDAYRDMYLDAGAGSTADSGVGMLAGSTLGGGTVINYSTSFATPDPVREQWDEEAGFESVFTGDEYSASSDAVHQRLGINTDNNQPPHREQLMEKGLRDLGWHVDAMPRNVSGCDPGQCGYCGLGCRSGSKQSTLRTWLEDAAAAGARIVVDADVRRITVAGDRTTGVEADVDGVPLTIRARAVVVAAGALNTPALLLRSGVGIPAAGKYLRLHPVNALWGRFAEPVYPWTGIMQALYSDEFANLDESGYGFKFETAAAHPMFPASFFGWESGEQFKTDVSRLKHMTPIGILLRDQGSGRVKTRRDGSPVWNYRLSKRDTKNMRLGVAKAAELLRAAGATEVLTSSLRPVRWDPRGSASLDDFMAEVDSVGFGPNQAVYVSFHQMGSARMGADRGLAVTDDENKVHGIDGLYVMDGSSFPTASGVNPMVSIQTIAHRAARALAAKLT